MKKTFVILEQGCQPNYPLTIKHKEQFNTEFSDCLRLNWKANKSDKGADFFKDNICWSEGRSYLYEQVKGKYDYYIFIDDDMDINSKTKLNPANEIKKLLEKYKPIHGSISNNSWPLLNNFTDEVIQMKGGDLCIQFFSENFANLVFPTWLHGSEKCMWYAQFIPYIICPTRSIFLNSVQGKNTRGAPHQDHNVDSFSPSYEVVKYFRSILKSSEHKHIFDNWRSPLDEKDRVPINPENNIFNITYEQIQNLLQYNCSYEQLAVHEPV